MTSAYGTSLNDPNATGDRYIKDLSYLPWHQKLRNGNIISIDLVRGENDVKSIETLLNKVIVEGKSWPFEESLTSKEFRDYFLSYAALIVRNTDGAIVGAFYCKPNFPGRCSHFCNGGFITDPQFRRQGIGQCMGRAFLRIARDIGFKAVLFNLVFASNIASTRLWDSLGFRRLARLPKVGRLSDGYSDAVQYYYDLESSDTTTRSKMKRLFTAVCSYVPRIGFFAILFMAGRISAKRSSTRN